MTLPGYVPVGAVVWSGGMHRRGEAPGLVGNLERRGEPSAGLALSEK